MPFGGFGGFNLMFGLMSVLFFVLFGVAIVRMITVWSKNNASPRLTVDATVVAKRTRVRHDGDGSSTRYYATFQFESGDRLELYIPHNQIGYLVEGDRGMLTFQGTRFLGFERKLAGTQFFFALRRTDFAMQNPRAISDRPYKPHFRHERADAFLQGRPLFYKNVMIFRKKEWTNRGFFDRIVRL